jgi:hypothetical protein
MVNFTNFTGFVTAAVGALVISTACVAAAVGPAAQVPASAQANA